MKLQKKIWFLCILEAMGVSKGRGLRDDSDLHIYLFLALGVRHVHGSGGQGTDITSHHITLKY